MKLILTLLAAPVLTLTAAAQEAPVVIEWDVVETVEETAPEAKPDRGDRGRRIDRLRGMDPEKRAEVRGRFQERLGARGVERGQRGERGQQGMERGRRGQRGQQGIERGQRGQRGQQGMERGQRGQRGQQGMERGQRGQRGQQGIGRGQRGQRGQRNNQRQQGAQAQDVRELLRGLDPETRRALRQHFSGGKRR